MSNVVSDVTLDMIVCPVDHQDLIYVASQNVLFNDRLNVSYPIIEGIPVLLAEESIAVDAEKAEEYRSHAVRRTGTRS